MSKGLRYLSVYVKKFEKKFICPAPKPCGVDECKKIIKCMPGTVPVPPPP